MRTDGDTKSPSRQGRRRSIEAILERRRRRQRRRTHTHAPDFLHGDCRIDEIYGEYGFQWVESTAFAEVLRGPDGRPEAWTVATFDEGFLTLRHAVDTEVDSLSRWLYEQLQDVQRVVLLDFDRGRAEAGLLLPDHLSLLPITPGASTFQSLEQERLKVTRDRDFPDRSQLRTAPDEILLGSRLNVTSTICLCARLD